MIENGSRRASLRRVVDIARNDSDGDWWRISRSNSAGYNKRFHGLLSGDSDDIELLREMTLASALTRAFKEMLTFHRDNRLKAMVEEKKSRGRVLALDLMGYGSVLRDLDIEGVAVCLKDRRNLKEIASDDDGGRTVIAGDIRSAQTWRKLHVYMCEVADGAKFDFIFCLPIGALYKIPSERIFYEYCFGKLYSTLSPNGGILLSQVNGRMTSLAGEAARALNEIEGIDAAFQMSIQGTAFMLTKHPNAPERLLN